MSNTATCANCHETIEHLRGIGWTHRHGGVGCGLIKNNQWKRAEPIPKKPSVVRHFGQQGYRPACGTAPSDGLDVHHDWKETTCQRCMGTLKFKQAKGMTVKEPVINPQKCVHCKEPISFHAWSSQWLHASGPNEPESEWCFGKIGLKATPPPLSQRKIEVTAPEPPEQEPEQETEGLTPEKPVCKYCGQDIRQSAHSRMWYHVAGGGDMCQDGSVWVEPALPKFEVKAPEPPQRENEAVLALRERIAAVELVLNSARYELEHYEGEVRAAQARLDQLNHALNLIGGA